MKTLETITSTHWQPSLTEVSGVVEGIDDIAQAIRIILTTPLGSDPHRPLFGSRIERYLDWPMNRATPYLVREAIEAITCWEPRIKVVAIQIKIDEYHLMLLVQWQTHTNLVQQTTVTYERTTATS